MIFGLKIYLFAVRSVLVDPYNVTGSKGVLERKTEWNGERRRKTWMSSER
jgi:hypothetical protein